MSINLKTFIKYVGPTIVKPKVPVWILVAILTAQYFGFGPSANTEPHCSLKVQNLHYSTYMIKQKGIDAIKMNVVSECNIPQEFTQIDATIFELLPNGITKKVHTFYGLKKFPDIQSPNRVIFKNIFLPCKLKNIAHYSGDSVGFARLINGKEIQISGHAKEFSIVNCKILTQ